MEDNEEFIELDSQTRDSLKNIGFTDYYINLYEGLLNYGEQNARDLSEKTGVPYSRIYKILNEMADKGIITKIDGRPGTFVGNDPQIVFNNVKKNIDEEFNSNISQSLPILRNLYGDKKVKTIKFNCYEGKASIDHINELIKNSARELKIIMKDFGEIIHILKNNLDFVYTKGVEVFLLVEKRLRDKRPIKELIQSRAPELFKIKFSPFIQESYVISDRREGLHGFRGHFNLANPESTVFTMLSSNDTTYIQYLNEIFNEMWESSEV